MKIIDLTEEQTELIEEGLSAHDDAFLHVKLSGSIRIGIEEDGQLIAGLDACITAFRILYVSTVFVEASHRRKGYGKALMQEMETRAKAMGDLCGFCDYAEGWIRHNPNGFCPDNFDPLGVIARPAVK